MLDVKSLKPFPLYIWCGWSPSRIKHLAEPRHISLEPWLKSTPAKPLSTDLLCMCVHLHIHMCICVCARSDNLFHTQRSPEAVIYPRLSLFIFLLPASPLPPPCCSPVWPQINRVHSVQTHSVTTFNHQLQKGPLRSTAHCSYRYGHAKCPEQHLHTYTHPQGHTNTRW